MKLGAIKKYLAVAAVLCLAAGIVVVLQFEGMPQNRQKIENGTLGHNPNPGIGKENYSLAFFLKFESSQYRSNLQILAKHLKQGDYLLVYGPPSTASDLITQVQAIKSLVRPDVNVISVVDYRDISNLTKTVPALPGGVDYVMYDYEGGSAFSREFTRDEKTSIGYFDEAQHSVQQYNQMTGGNAKLFVTPPYGQLRKADWNWGLVSDHVDVMDMQLQGYLHDPNLKNYAAGILGQIRPTSPDKLVFVQLSINPKRGTLQDNVRALDSLSDVAGINAFIVYYLPNQGSDLSQFFSMLGRE